MSRSIASILLLSLAVAASPLVSGCSGSADLEDLAPIDEATDDVVSVSKLLGSYSEGRGLYASISFTQTKVSGKKQNRFEAKRIVQCVTAPCPAVDVSGRWYTRSGTLSLYPEGGSTETYKTKLVDRTLTLSNKSGLEIAKLTKAIPAPTDVPAILAKHGVPKMRVEIDPNEVTNQASATGVTTKFAAALDKSLGLFLTEASALKGTANEFADDLQSECGSTDLVRCLANAPRTSVRLLGLSDDTAPHGESAAASWVFVFFVDDFTDHAYFAVVPKKGNEAAYVYAFN